MRMLLALLIFMVGFSGYSAAAHAFSMNIDTPAKLSKKVDDTVNSADHDKVKSEKTCDCCTHCCGSHVLMSNDSSLGLTAQLSSLIIAPGNTNTGNYIFSFYTPPKSFV